MEHRVVSAIFRDRVDQRWREEVNLFGWVFMLMFFKRVLYNSLAGVKIALRLISRATAAETCA